MKKVIILFFLLAFFLSACIPETLTKSEEEANCSKAGESIPVHPDYRCCEGLELINDSPREDGSCFEGLLVGGGICSDCGNNKCEEWENKCSCPKDCP